MTPEIAPRTASRAAGSRAPPPRRSTHVTTRRIAHAGSSQLFAERAVPEMRRLRLVQVIDTLADVMLVRGITFLRVPHVGARSGFFY